jgi:integrase/recombinase XerD
MNDPFRVRMSGPLEPFAAGFSRSLARQGYTPVSAARQVQLMAHLSRWLTGEGRDVRGFGATDVERFLSARSGAGHTHYLTANAMRPMLAYLRDQGVWLTPSPAVLHRPADVALDRYRHYLVHERGLGHATARQYVDAVRPFVCQRLSPDGVLDWD